MIWFNLKCILLVGSTLKQVTCLNYFHLTKNLYRLKALHVSHLPVTVCYIIEDYLHFVVDILSIGILLPGILSYAQNTNPLLTAHCFSNPFCGKKCTLCKSCIFLSNLYNNYAWHTWLHKYAPSSSKSNPTFFFCNSVCSTSMQVLWKQILKICIKCMDSMAWYRCIKSKWLWHTQFTFTRVTPAPVHGTWSHFGYGSGQWWINFHLDFVCL